MIVRLMALRRTFLAGRMMKHTIQMYLQSPTEGVLQLSSLSPLKRYVLLLVYIYIYIVLLFFLDKCFLWNLVILNSFIIASLKYVVYASRMKESLYTFSVFFIMVKVETSVLNLPVDKMDYFVPG